jgi:hypothetical protein
MLNCGAACVDNRIQQGGIMDGIMEGTMDHDGCHSDENPASQSDAPAAF